MSPPRFQLLPQSTSSVSTDRLYMGKYDDDEEGSTESESWPPKEGHRLPLIIESSTPYTSHTSHFGPHTGGDGSTKVNFDIAGNRTRANVPSADVPSADVPSAPSRSKADRSWAGSSYYERYRPETSSNSSSYYEQYRPRSTISSSSHTRTHSAPSTVNSPSTSTSTSIRYSTGEEQSPHLPRFRTGTSFKQSPQAGSAASRMSDSTESAISRSTRGSNSKVSSLTESETTTEVYGLRWSTPRSAEPHPKQSSPRWTTMAKIAREEKKKEARQADLAEMYERELRSKSKPVITGPPAPSTMTTNLEMKTIKAVIRPAARIVSPSSIASTTTSARHRPSYENSELGTPTKSVINATLRARAQPAILRTPEQRKLVNAHPLPPIPPITTKSPAQTSQPSIAPKTPSPKKQAAASPGTPQRGTTQTRGTPPVLTPLPQTQQAFPHSTPFSKQKHTSGLKPPSREKPIGPRAQRAMLYAAGVSPQDYEKMMRKKREREEEWKEEIIREALERRG